MNIVPPRATAATPYPTNIPALTSLRFFAALWVVSLHFTGWLSDPSIQRWPAVANGLLGVDFFFILSGWHQIAEQRLHARPFIVKRLARAYSNFGYLHILPEFNLGIALYRLGAQRRLRLLENAAAVPLLVLAVVAAAVLGLRLSPRDRCTTWARYPLRSTWFTCPSRR